MDIQSEFTEKFYNLCNAPIAQSKKNFNAFINEIDNKITQGDVRCELIANFEPRNKLEISFKIDLLTRYRMYDKIMEILKTDTNSLYVSNILKNWTFFKETFKDITPNELVNDILPNLSYSTRMKVLNRISKNLFDEKLADEYFAAVEDKYEIVSASVLLGSCSIPLVTEKMEKYDLILSFKQVETILRKDITFLDYYLDRTRSSLRAKTCNKRKLLKIIYKRDEELFWKLSEKYKIVLHCGKRLTRKIIRDHQHFLIDKREEYPVNLKRRIMYQVWKKNSELFKTFIKNNSPEDESWYFLGNRRSYYTTIFAEYDRYISEDRQYNFLNYAFKERFGCNIHDKLELITKNLLLLMPEELRDNILKIKIEGDEDLLNICRPEISFPIILEKIKHASDMYKRIEYLQMLLKTCVHNKNADYLLKALQYVEKRHRNDTQALKRFFQCLQSWENLEKLTIEHWTHIDAIEKLLIIQKETVNENYFLVKRIGHLLNNNLDIDEHMRRYLGLIRKDMYLYKIFDEIPQYEKYCVLELKKYIDEIKDKSEYEHVMFKYFDHMHNYNISHPEDKLPTSHVIPLIKSFSTEHPSAVQSLIVFYIEFCYADLNPIVWQHPESLFWYESLFNWYLRHHKDEILDKIELILPILSVRTNKMFVYKLDEYSYRNLPQIVTNFCIDVLKQTEEAESIKINAIDILAVINQDEFLKIAAEFKPTEDGKIDPSNSSENIELLSAVLKNLKKLVRPLDGLNIVSKFCKGDYLKYSLAAVYSTTFRAPEKSAKTFLAQLHKSAVSTRKHTINISKIICRFDEFYNFVKEQAAAEKNPSLKTILFKKSLEYAHIMPSEKSWELIKVTMRGIDRDDVESHDLLLEIGKIPKQYRSLYIPEVYTQLNSNKNLTINQKKYEFIRVIPAEVIDELNQDLLEIFLSEVMFNKQATLGDSWTNLIFYSSGQKQATLLDYALKRFEDYHRSNPDESISNKKTSFLSPLCDGILRYRLDTRLVQKVSEVWFNAFNPEIDVRGNIYLSCIVAYSKCDYNFKGLPGKIDELLQSFLRAYNGYLLDIFEKPLTNFITTVDDGGDKGIHFVKSFLEGFPSVPNYLILIRLLASFYDIPKEAMDDYIALIRKIKEHPERCVRVCLYDNLPSKYNYLLK